MADNINFKRGLNANVAALTLQSGEPAFVTDTGKLYVGNGTDKVLINPSPESWIVPTLLNGWVNYGSLGFANAGYYKDPLGIVRLRGFIKDGTLGSNMFVLPVGYRSLSYMRFPAISNDVFAQLQIAPDGSIVNVGPASNVWFSLEGFTFLAEQ